jgi:nucleotide-binding universal stress UspA family protein
MIEISTISPPEHTLNAQPHCDGGCKGCGKAHIKLFSSIEEERKQLREHTMLALQHFNVPHKIIEVSEPNALALAGVKQTPALALDGQVMVEGRMPNADEITHMMYDRYLYRSKIHRLKTIGVAVDLTSGGESTLRYAWNIAQCTHASIEVVYVMDSIFDGHTPSSTGFLSGYQRTMQTELDAFIQEKMAPLGVDYLGATPNAPGTSGSIGAIKVSSRVLYGFPDSALEEYSKNIDLLVLGTSSRSGLTLKFFGSVAVEVSKFAHCPVLLVPPDAVYSSFKHILYASNFDSLSSLRVRQAASFAQHFEAQLHFVHVGPPGERNLDLERKILESGFRASDKEKPFLFAKMVSDNVAESLYEYAFYHRIDLLVFVTHQRSFWENIMHHSVTREVAFSTDLPMLVIHGDGDMI